MPSYEIVITDAFGDRLLVPRDWERLDYARVENDYAPLSLILPAHYARAELPKDGGIEVWRDGKLQLETVYLMRDWVKIPHGRAWRWQVTAYDLNYLLTGRTIDYAADSAQSKKSADQADDMMKAIVRENFTTATDTTRRINTYLSVEADAGLAQSVTKAFANRPVLNVLKDLAQMSFQLGTYLVFDAVAKSLSTQPRYEFRTYINQRGYDLRTGQQFALVGPAFGNVAAARVEESASGEVTRVIAGGQGTGAARTYGRSTESARLNDSPFALRELFINASQVDLTASELQDEARAHLKTRRSVKRFTGELLSTPGFAYGRDWGWGDRLTAQVYDDSFDCRINAIRISVTQAQGEEVRASLKGEL